MEWSPEIRKKFEAMIVKIPVFHRRITEEAVNKRAQAIAQLRQAKAIEEQDVVAAFFSDVPSPFYSMMVRLLEQSGFDYRKYGFPRNNKPL